MADTTGATAAAAASGGGDGGLSEEERLAAMMNKIDAGDALRRYSWLSQRCFNDCVSTFYRKALGKGEGACVRACVRKYLLVKSASGAKFAELAGLAPAASFDEDDD